MCLLNDDQGRATNEAKKGEDVKDMLSGPMPIMPLNLTTNMMMRMRTEAIINDTINNKVKEKGIKSPPFSF